MHPRLEFFTFKLRHSSDEIKTFRDFLLDQGKVTRLQKDRAIFSVLYDYFLCAPLKNYKKDELLKKSLAIIPNRKFNKYYDERPKPNFNESIISGVINAGPFGKEGILGNISDIDNVHGLGRNQTILHYHYIFVYLPLNHDQGFFMVHSDTQDERITQSCRKWVSDVFRGGAYLKPEISLFMPRSFMDSYKNDAQLDSISFKNRINNKSVDIDDPITEKLKEFDIQITITPKKKLGIGYLSDLKKYLSKAFFKAPNINFALENSDKISVNTKNPVMNTSKVFTWNEKDKDFYPTIYLENYVTLDESGTPIFSELDKYCYNLFTSEILLELRRDLYVERVD